MKLYQIIVGATSTLFAFTGNSTGAEPMSKVRRAAIEQMQGRLGSIRGSIKPDTQNIFLTEAMIDNLKPIRLAVPTKVAVTSNTLEPNFPENSDPLDQKTSNQLAREIYRSVGLENVNRNFVTNSLDGSLPSTSDIEALERAVDRMLSSKQ